MCSNISKEGKIAGMEQMNTRKVGVEIRRKTGKMLSRKCYLASREQTKKRSRQRNWE